METYKHKYLNDWIYNTYANLDTLEDSVNFNYWRVDLVHYNTFIPVVENVMTLIKDIIDSDNGDYRWYSTFTFPVVPNNCYRFVIIDTANSDNVVYISDILESTDSTDDLILCKYRNAKNILNYNYEVLTSFYNIFHVELKKRKPTIPLRRQGYDLESGSFFPIRTIRTKTYEFITGWFDEEEHDATNAMIIHSDLLLGIDGTYIAYTFGQDATYDAQFEEDYGFVQASFRLEQDNESSSNKAL